jgi:glycosyltransferase involved in cell wall biosynthesis
VSARLPDVSIVIPTHDRRELIGRAVASCRAGAGADPAVEVIVVDDGSRDGTPEILRAGGEDIVLLRFEPPGGRGRARNAGMEIARGEFVKFLDDDDWLAPGALAEEVQLARDSGADIVAGGHLSAGESEGSRYFAPPPFAHGIDSILRGEAVPTAAALYRRAAIGELRWDERATKLDDWHFFVRVALRPSRIVPLDRPVYTWWSHPGQGVRNASMLDNAREFYWVLDEIERTLAGCGELTAARRQRLAQYRYKELRTLGRFDRNAFEVEVARILSLDPRFRPVDEERAWWMRAAAWVFGFRVAIELHEAARRAILGSPE